MSPTDHFYVGHPQFMQTSFGAMSIPSLDYSYPLEMRRNLPSASLPASRMHRAASLLVSSESIALTKACPR